MRVFIGLTEVNQQYSGLRKAFDALGVQATYWNITHNHYHVPSPDDNLLVRWCRACHRGSLTHRRRVVRGVSKTAHRLLAVMLFLWAAARHDVFIFGVNSTFCHFLDLPVLKALGKKIVYRYHGTDSFPIYMTGKVLHRLADPERSSKKLVRWNQALMKKIAKVDRYADAIFDLPSQALLHRRKIVIHTHIGHAVKPDVIPPAPEPVPSNGKTFRLFHCSQLSKSKGSEEIQAAVERLAAQGYPVELVFVYNRPHQEVLEEMAACDLVVDQLYADYPLSVVATEACWLGKPVLVGGYGVDLWRGLFSYPTVFVEPHEYEGAIQKLLDHPQELRAIGRRCRAFVEEHWQPAQIAQRYLDAAFGKLPESWTWDPADATYIYGMGVTKPLLRETYRRIIEHEGRAALGLADKPALEQAVVDFASAADGDSETAVFSTKPFGSDAGVPV